MITFKEGSIFDSGCHVLVNPVNCVGVMGKGLALRFKELFPQNFIEYRKNCSYKRVRIGEVTSCLDRTFSKRFTKPVLVINFPTKQHWAQKSDYDFINRGLIALSCFIEENNITEIAIPAIGCGLGGLDWAVVKDSIIRVLSNFQDVNILVYEP
jgi:O-acetyl-ADP-ribose deacetylase (regulator of RNase III)